MRIIINYFKFKEKIKQIDVINVFKTPLFRLLSVLIINANVCNKQLCKQ